MSHKMSLQTQTGKIWLIIRKNEYIEEERIINYLNTYALEYAYICHCHDFDEKGVLEGVHYHFVYNLKEQYKRDRLLTTLNHVTTSLGFDNADGIQIEKYDSFEGCLQYLTHKNQPTKTQHNKSEIITNLDKESFDLYYDVNLEDVFSYDFVFTKCISCTSKLDVIKQCWGWYSKNSTYQRVINEVWELTHRKGVI